MASRNPDRKKAKPQLSDEALAMVAQRFRALGDATRLKIVQLLFGGERSVQTICDHVGTSQANVSRHLGALVDQGLLSRRREGLYAYYSIADPTLFALCELVCTAMADRFERARIHFESA
jgi:ArsR family transcriptional regulator